MAKGNSVGAGPLAAAWAITAAGFVLKTLLTGSSVPLILDTDDAMRLTEVHDFLGGQNWFDLVQHRLNTPFGGEIHWSRLIDLPEATLLFLLRPVAGGLADVLLAYLWPLAMLAILLWLSARLALRLGGHEALWPALLLPAFSLITMGEFVPGRLDHHSAQILLTLAILSATIAALERPRFAIAAGIAAAAAITIGIEGLPMVAATVAIYALMWVADRRYAEALRDFGLSFACATALGLAQGVPPPRWLELRLDAISIVYALAALLCGLAFLALSLAPLRSWLARLVVALVAAAIVIVILLWIDPAIPEGPYAALDPWLLANWLPAISEAESFARSFASDPVYPMAVTVPVIVALVYALWHAVRLKPGRAPWLIYFTFLAAGLLVMIVQIRAARIVTPLAVPGSAALIAAAWRASFKRRGIVPALGVAGSALVSMGIVVAIIGVVLVPATPGSPGSGTSSERNGCLQPSAFAELAAEPPVRIMAPIDLGSHLLLLTPHAVVGAPYHRSQQGVLDTFRFFNQPIDVARGILEARGVSLVVICPAMKEIRGLVAHTPDSFVSLYAEKALPAWLVDQSLPGNPLKVYAVMPR